MHSVHVSLIGMNIVNEFLVKFTWVNAEEMDINLIMGSSKI